MDVGSIEIKVFRENYGKASGDIITSTKDYVKLNIKITEKALKGSSKSHGAA